MMANKKSIPKNRSDQEMFLGSEEVAESGTKQPLQDGNTKPTGSFASFFTPDLQEQIGKELLNLKIKLYNEGIIDFDIKVKTIGNEIILTPKPKRKVKKV